MNNKSTDNPNDSVQNVPVGVKTKKPFYKRVWFIILIIVIALFIIGGSLGDSGDSSSQTKQTQTVQEKPAKEQTAKEKKQAEIDKMTASQKNAYKSATNYLSVMAFSKKGLIKQLSSEVADGYSKEDAKFAVEFIEKHHEVNWKKQAYKTAEEYLDSQSFSESGLVEQLEYEGFTHGQAVYGAHKAYSEQ